MASGKYRTIDVTLSPVNKKVIKADHILEYKRLSQHLEDSSSKEEDRTGIYEFNFPT